MKCVVAMCVVAAGVAAQTPSGVLDLLGLATRALADKDARAFLECFDRGITGYDALARHVAVLVGSEGAESSVEIVKDEGDDRRRTLEVDWLLRVGTAPARREILKIEVERQGRGWKITALAPVEFFAR